MAVATEKKYTDAVYNSNISINNDFFAVVDVAFDLRAILHFCPLEKFTLNLFIAQFSLQ